MNKWKHFIARGSIQYDWLCKGIWVSFEYSVFDIKEYVIDGFDLAFPYTDWNEWKHNLR